MERKIVLSLFYMGGSHCCCGRDNNYHHLLRIFPPRDKGERRARGGTGLGLSIVRHIAQRHDAQISVESTVNVGTKITVIFK